MEHLLLAVDDRQPELLEREQNRRMADVDTERSVREPVLVEDGVDLLRAPLGPLALRGHRAVLRRDPGLRPALKPRAVERVMPRRGSEVPNVRLAVSPQEKETGRPVVTPPAAS